jgi:spermidine synthase
LTIIYGATLFLSAALLFMIQLILSKMVLPLLGGSPAVWTTCMLFFQIVLLLGYAYAHGTSESLVFRRQASLHLLLLALSLRFVPVVLPSGTVPPTQEMPIPWLLALLAATLGVPFFLLSATAPLLQRWFSRTAHSDAENPYFLYAASNAGSLLGLLSYPVVIEPALPLAAQRQVWGWGYWLLCAAILLCAVTAWRHLDPAHMRSVPSEPARWADRARWTLLAFVPSSLLLGVTSYISTDIAAIPFIWVVPLFLYLLTFVLVFAHQIRAPLRAAAHLQPWLVIPIVLLWYWGIRGATPGLLVLHVLFFFVTALICHGELARRRPPAAALTEFYFWMSVGGALGGIANGILAPILFHSVIEYPLALLAGTALVPSVLASGAGRSNEVVTWMQVVLAGIALAVGGWLAGHLNSEPGVLTRAGIIAIAISSAVAAASCLALRGRSALLALSLAGVLLASRFAPSDRTPVIHAERNFFGVLRVRAEQDGRYHSLYHGTTLHGAQMMGSEGNCEPLTYYTRRGPLGQAFRAIPTKPNRSVGVVGLGTGTVASYALPGEQWTFFEIDPAVERIARDPTYFRFLSKCLGRVDVVKGDGRLRLARVPDASFDILLLDAFSSDAIPVHLLTREALAVYRAKVRAGGVILFHLSNRHLRLVPVVAALARDAGWIGRFAVEVPDPRSPSRLATGSLWAVLAREEADLGELSARSDWPRLPTRAGERVWTDDYSNVWGALMR